MKIHYFVLPKDKKSTTVTPSIKQFKAQYILAYLTQVAEESEAYSKGLYSFSSQYLQAFQLMIQALAQSKKYCPNGLTSSVKEELYVTPRECSNGAIRRLYNYTLQFSTSENIDLIDLPKTLT